MKIMSFLFTPRQNEGYCNHNVCRRRLSVDILVNTITWPILIRSWWNFTGLILDGKWRSLLNFVMMTSSVTSFPIFCPWACEHDNLTISHPNLMKLHRIDPWWKMKNPIEFHNDDVISDIISGILSPELVNTITWPFFIRSQPNLVWLMLYEYSRTLLNDVTITSSVTSQW